MADDEVKTNGSDPDGESTEEVVEGLIGQPKTHANMALVQQLKQLTAMAEAGKLQAMLLVGMLDNGFTLDVPLVTNVHQALLLLGALGVMRAKTEMDIATSQARPQPAIVRATPDQVGGLYRR